MGKRNSVRVNEGAAKLDGLLPHAFLLAVARSKSVVLHGQRFMPTRKQREEARQRLLAALEGKPTEDDEDNT